MKPEYKLYKSAGEVEQTAVTIGVFDGVHLGHRHLLEELSAEARRRGQKSLAVVLSHHPAYVLGHRNAELWIDEAEERIEKVAQYVDCVAELTFTPELAALTACEMAQWMHDQLGMRTLLTGYDSRFGSLRNDDFLRLPEYGAEAGFEVLRGEPYMYDGGPVSSSRIRTALAEGDVGVVSSLMGRPYSIGGTVGHGRGVGHTLGFPTANIDLSGTRKLLPKEGVYAVTVGAHAGMANLGGAPTFSVEKPMLEVHLLDFDGDLYGETVAVEFQRRLRDIIRFDTPRALEEQLKKDLNACREK